jgi:hypothetical protein
MEGAMSDELTIIPQGDELTIIPPAGLPASRDRGSMVLTAALKPLTRNFEVAGFCEKVLMNGATVNGLRLPPEGADARILVVNDQLAADNKSIEASVAETRMRSIKDSKTVHSMLLRSAPAIDAAIEQFGEILNPDDEALVKPKLAAQMVRTLFGAVVGKKRTDEDAEKLEGCLLLFDPTVNAIGPATGLWRETPRHPVVMALAVLDLIHEQVFSPSSAELTSACRRAHNRLRRQYQHMETIIKRLRCAEEILFDYARDEWASIYAVKENRAALWPIGYPIEGKSFKEWVDALDEFDHAENLAAIRELIGNNGELAKCEVQEGKPVPRGVNLQSMPSELIERLPHFERLKYFLTEKQIVLVEDNTMVELISRKG